jgi:hypothetical protein
LKAGADAELLAWDPDASFLALVGGGRVDARLLAPVSDGGVDARFSAPVGGGGVDARFSEPVSGGGVDARFSAPVSGGGVDALVLAPVSGGGVTGLGVRRVAESAVAEMRPRRAALLATAAPARRSTAARRRSHATVARYSLRIASGTGNNVLRIPSASLRRTVPRDFLEDFFFLECAIVPPINQEERLPVQEVWSAEMRTSR